MRREIFVSVPLNLNENQNKFCESIEKYLRNIGYEPLTIGRNFMPYEAIYKEVREKILFHCDGCIILGFKRSDSSTTSHWNHLEAGIALAIDMPILRLIEEGIDEKGIFDRGNGLGPCIKIRFEPDSSFLTDRKFMQPFNSWNKKVEEFIKKQEEIRHFFDRLPMNGD